MAEIFLSIFTAFFINCYGLYDHYSYYGYSVKGDASVPACGSVDFLTVSYYHYNPNLGYLIREFLEVDGKFRLYLNSLQSSRPAILPTSRRSTRFSMAPGPFSAALTSPHSRAAQ
jgi:hypothetical protein